MIGRGIMWKWMSRKGIKGRTFSWESNGGKTVKAIPIILPSGIHMTYPSKHGVLNLAASNIVFGKYEDVQGKE